MSDDALLQRFIAYAHGHIGDDDIRPSERRAWLDRDWVFAHRKINGVNAIVISMEGWQAAGFGNGDDEKNCPCCGRRK